MKRILPTIPLLALAGLLGNVLATGALFATPSEERFAALEERLARLEKALERLAEKVDTNSLQEANGRKELTALTKEAREIHLDQSSLRQQEKTQPVPSEAPSGASVIPTEKQDEAEEGGSPQILNVPYAGYMETHLNHDGVNPTTFDFNGSFLLSGTDFADGFAS